ncbi:hypothetical protein CL654_00735 [bacterium]|nr:hypothetical protein [bacterium]|tara:strand:- start:9880 stop:10227 length:348 start_codon:yes stop_codon:yes gene_type:complete
MDKAIEGFHDYVMNDVLGDVRGVTSKKMFGGYGIYKNGTIFALIVDNGELYFKVDEELKEKFKKAGSEPFVYTGHKTKKATEMPYWLLPEKVMEDPDELQEWVEDSVAVSKKSKK